MSITKVPLGRSTWARNYAGEIDLPLLNRFFEKDITSTIDDTALLARPGTSFYKAFGSTPLRGIFSQPGFLGGDLFVCANRTLYRWDGTTLTTLTGTLSDSAAPVSITYQASPGVERLWLADGVNLWYYEGEFKAQGTLTALGQPSNGDVVRMGAIYYQFVTSGVDAGTPAGTVTDPWLVLIGLTTEGSLQNLGDAVDASGTPGGTYSTSLTANPNIEKRRVEPTRLVVQARIAGVAGNTLVTTDTSVNLNWAAGTLLNGGDNILVPVGIPEDEPVSASATSVCTLAAYVIISVADSQRMYFIRPAEFWVEIFAEAESEPDQVLQVATVGGTFWALGQTTIEPWSPTGDADIPFAPIQGRQLRYGIIAGTAQVMQDDIIYFDSTGVCRNTSGERLSNHAIEEAFRLRT